MVTIDYYQRLTEEYNLNNTPLLVASGVSFAVGYMQYVYAIRVLLREGNGPMPFWMHSFYLAHDSTWSYILGKAASRYDEHWFLRGTSTALFVWTTLEIFCIHRSITKTRNACFASVLGPNPSLASVLPYAAFLQMAMYCVVWFGIILMGEGCVMQWFCLTNVLIIVGPTHEYLRRGSRDGLALGFCLVNIICAIWTFTPFSMWALTLPEIFAQPMYYCAGCFMFLYSLWAFYIVYSYPAKKPSKKDPSPIW
ncbi:hypothetical protein LCI18_003105 [Fusarium solani-melongenae]|uniref:Uncharacterized protein n=1 Tax=Fusarium solani subsp. cucurbitae TaxID=2747967 RepID=A0ACD3YTE2_FUSSC|nr:hypothetical protein LCI18_003105 [Fusarium solani-melongenae]